MDPHAPPPTLDPRTAGHGSRSLPTLDSERRRRAGDLHVQLPTVASAAPVQHLHQAPPWDRAPIRDPAAVKCSSLSFFLGLLYVVDSEKERRTRKDLQNMQKFVPQFCIKMEDEQAWPPYIRIREGSSILD
ncbi:uncharacterized protein LOC123409180 [Hordeum vulgare subsp. vulgare]|uniref:uncharacterized protein LOC123409180 n=1 Tax=Hordeum vulgare subsp. vulgare TaxID=112509 RepID=UPI00162B1B98|nr:uncharacterized protein LOC123409180 [Hordeum vulgare subsp. vulgare]